jgi:ribosome-associated protein
MSDIRVGRILVIPEAEIQLRFTTAGGPGGQHSNRSSTRVELVWNPSESAVLSARQKALLRSQLRHRINNLGQLRVAADSSRSQLRNRQEAERRLARLIGEALRPRKVRRTTQPTNASRERRLRDKHHRSQVKKLRRRGPDT